MNHPPDITLFGHGQAMDDFDDEGDVEETEFLDEAEAGCGGSFSPDE